MIQGVIFDCFGVLYEGSLSYLASLASPENRNAVYDVNRSADYGYISHDEYLQSMAELLGMAPSDVEKVSRPRFVRNDELVEYVRQLRTRCKTGLLSNVGKNVMETLFTPEEMTELFDVVVLSGEVGIVKPNPEIFTMAAERLGLQPWQCVMVDDLVKNAEGAEMAGMKAVVYGSVRQTKSEIEMILLQEKPGA